MSPTFLLASFCLVCLLLPIGLNAQNTQPFSKEELTQWLNQGRDCPPDAPVYFYRLDYFDFKGDGSPQAIVVASTCMTGTAGPDIHSVITRRPSGPFVELEIPDAPREAYDGLFGNRNYTLRVQDGFLVAIFDDDPDRPTPLVIKYKWNGKAFSIASIKKTGVFPASYDCAKAETEVERAVCHVKELADLDLRLNSAYKAALAGLPADKRDARRSDQRAWIAARDKECAPYKGWVECLRISYQERIQALQKDMPSRDSSGAASKP